MENRTAGSTAPNVTRSRSFDQYVVALWGSRRLGFPTAQSDWDYFLSRPHLTLRGAWRIARCLAHAHRRVVVPCGVGWPLIRLSKEISLVVVPYDAYELSEAAYLRVERTGAARARAPGEHKLEYYASLGIPSITTWTLMTPTSSRARYAAAAEGALPAARLQSWTYSATEKFRCQGCGGEPACPSDDTGDSDQNLCDYCRFIGEI